MDSKVPKSAVKRKPPGGSRKGRPNKTTATLKDAILLAAAAVGEDGKGKGKLTGYLKFVAASDTKAFASLLGKVLPLQIAGPNGGPIPFADIPLKPEQRAVLVERMLSEF